ncbi:MAG: VOC family protein [Asgard group archaeon]|nr:VOC family protein [Asgard group archaeon]
MENKFAHVEIPVKDVKKAKKFYEDVFNWEVQVETGFPGYAFFKTGETGIGGAFDESDKTVSGDLMLYIEVEDIPATSKKIKVAGGKITKDKTEIGGEMGYYAVFEDVFGNVLGLWAAK